MNKHNHSAGLKFEVLEDRSVPANWSGDDGYTPLTEYVVPHRGSVIFQNTEVEGSIPVNGLTPGDEVRVRATLTPGPNPPGPTTLTIGRESRQGLLSISGRSEGQQSFTADKTTTRIEFRAANYDFDDTARIRVDIRRRPDVEAVSLGMSDDRSRLQLRVAVRRNILPQDVPVTLFWANTRGELLQEIGRNDTTLRRGVQAGSVLTISLPTARLAQAPTGATRVIAVIDPDNRLVETNEGNNRAQFSAFAFRSPGTAATRGGDRYVVYKNEVRVNGDRSWRNNNPGNLMFAGGFAARHGAIGRDGNGFAIFPDAATGREALIALLQSPGYRNLSVTDTIRKYAPPRDNDTARYQRFVRQQTGLDPARLMRSLNGAELKAVADAITRFEGSRTGTVFTATGMPLPQWVQSLLA